MAKAFEDITREEFVAYEGVRRRGRYNMFDPNARALTGLDKDTYTGIIKRYESLVKKFPGVRK